MVLLVALSAGIVWPILLGSQARRAHRDRRRLVVRLPFQLAFQEKAHGHNVLARLATESEAFALASRRRGGRIHLLEAVRTLTVDVPHAVLDEIRVSPVISQAFASRMSVAAPVTRY